MTRMRWDGKRKYDLVRRARRQTRDEQDVQKVWVRELILGYTGRNRFMLSVKDQAKEPGWLPSARQIAAVKRILGL